MTRGLSPRVRGNHGHGRAGDPHWRSIPACAGEPSADRVAASANAVYPRVCGGTRLRDVVTMWLMGLSPRVRGNPVPTVSQRVQMRSIPACAGEPTWHPFSGGRYKVYPRVCGGTRSAARTGRSERGLSPRVRGNPRRGRKTPAATRSIPACAGEPPGIPGTRIRQRVYPRVCGGTSSSSRCRPQCCGLSPRVRGNLMQGDDYRDGKRSIPACAGEPGI